MKHAIPRVKKEISVQTDIEEITANFVDEISAAFSRSNSGDRVSVTTKDSALDTCSYNSRFTRENTICEGSEDSFDSKKNVQLPIHNRPLPLAPTPEERYVLDDRRWVDVPQVSKKKPTNAQSSKHQKNEKSNSYVQVDKIEPVNDWNYRSYAGKYETPQLGNQSKFQGTSKDTNINNCTKCSNCLKENLPQSHKSFSKEIGARKQNSIPPPPPPPPKSLQDVFKNNATSGEQKRFNDKKPPYFLCTEEINSLIHQKVVVNDKNYFKKSRNEVNVNNNNNNRLRRPSHVADI